MRSAPLFGSVELARLVEATECSMLVSSTENASIRRPACGARVVRVAGGVAIWAGEGSPLNKVAGLGFAGAPSAEELDEVERLFSAHAAPVRVELASVAH